MSYSIEENQSQVKALVEYVTVLKSEVQALQAAVASQTAKTVETGARFSMRLSEAPAFEGKTDLGREATDWARFAKSFVEVVGGHGNVVVAFALTNKFRGFAKEWFTAVSAADMEKWNTPESVIAEVEKKFISSRDSYNLRVALLALKQGAKQSFLEYTVQFEALATRLGDLNGEQQLFAYLQGMLKTNRDFIVGFNPTTFESAKVRASCRDAQLGHMLSGHGEGAMDIDQIEGQGEESLPQPLHQTIAELVAAVKDLGAVGHRRHSGGGLSDRQRQFLMKNKGCFYCKQPNAGHRAVECPEKARAGGRYSVANPGSRIAIQRPRMGSLLLNKPLALQLNSLQITRK